MDLQKIKEEVKKAITDVVDANGDGGGTRIGDEDSLIDSGVIDSLGAIQLIEAFSEKFNVIFFPTELSLDNFDSIDKISLFIQSKLNGDQQ